MCTSTSIYTQQTPMLYLTSRLILSMHQTLSYGEGAFFALLYSSLQYG